mgnify:CR=1 FL=1
MKKPEQEPKKALKKEPKKEPDHNQSESTLTADDASLLEIDSPAFPCPECKKPLQRKEGKRGIFWACTGFPKCRVTRNDFDGKPADSSDERYRCPLCTRPLVRADKERGDYWFCSGYNKGCKITVADENGRPELSWRCRECGSLLQKRNGKHGEFWGCSQYPECTASYRNENDRPLF